MHASGHSPTIVQVALPVPLRRLFDYFIPEELTTNLKPGIRVRAPFGNRQLVGIVIKTSDTSSLPQNKLKALSSCLDEDPVFNEELLDLCHWAANYYLHPIGEVLQLALPAILRQGKEAKEKEEKFYSTTETAPAADHIAKKAPKQAEVIAAISSHPRGLSHSGLKVLGLTGQPLKALIDKGWLSVTNGTPHDPQEEQEPTHSTLLAEAPLTLNPSQTHAVKQISEQLSGFKTFLLAGVTGSGKTEVYLQAAAEALSKGRSVLVLVPEIGLTLQTVSRFRQRFTCPVHNLHSGFTDLERLKTWRAAQDAEPKIILGTRSAVFTPIKGLGLIVIDEEYDASYKQQESFRYSARDIAIVRARELNIPIVLGSATPSLESLHNCHTDRYQLLQLPHRAGEATKPSMQVLDIRSRALQGAISQPLVEQIAAHLEQQNQVLLFLNRRGFAPILLCHDCGWQASCDHCDANYTLHAKQNLLKCHHCGHQKPIPSHCPSCNGTNFVPVGHGTERSEDSIAKLFPNYPVIRIDRDTTRGKSNLDHILEHIRRGEPSILIGTQMLAKGHHFPKVTLAAILDVDSGLFSADFRAIERMGQLVTQVAGRAGRAEQPGTVILQTHQPENPILSRLLQDDYLSFARQMLQDREAAQLPPFTYMATIRAESIKAELAYDLLENARKQLSSYTNQSEIEVIGPFPASIARKAGRYRALLILQAEQRIHLHRALAPLATSLEDYKTGRHVRWAIDIDPIEMF